MVIFNHMGARIVNIVEGGKLNNTRVSEAHQLSQSGTHLPPGGGGVFYGRYSLTLKMVPIHKTLGDELDTIVIMNKPFRLTRWNQPFQRYDSRGTVNQ